MQSNTSLLYDYAISPFYDRLVRIWPAWVHPNVITCLGGVGAAASLVAMEHGQWGAACAAYTLYHMFDNMDGKHARRTGTASAVGHILDHVIDGTVGLAATSRTFCECFFDFPHALSFALCCAMAMMLACHAAEHATGLATLGTRIFSADELFLLCSFALGHRAATGSPVVLLGPEAQAAWWPVVSSAWVLLICVLALLTVRRPAHLAALAAFGAFCAAAPSCPLPQAAVYFPALATLLVLNSRHKQHKRESKRP